MKKEFKTETTILRQKAELLLKKNNSKSGSQLSEAKIQKLIHELEVHQIELEMQNEEVMLSKNQAELATEKDAVFFDFAPSCYFTLSQTGKIIELNDIGAKLLGKELSFIKNNNFGFFVTNDTRPVFNLFLAKVFASKDKVTCKVNLSTIRNLLSYVHLTGIVTENGEQCLVTVLDITEQKSAADELKSKKEELEMIFNLVPAQIWYKDTQNNFICVNRQVCSDLGMTNEKIEGHSAEELFPSFAQQYFKDDLEVFNSRKPKLGIIEHVNTANGEMLWVHSDKVPVFGKDGQVDGLMPLW